jgi:hypothetical protein
VAIDVQPPETSLDASPIPEVAITRWTIVPAAVFLMRTARGDGAPDAKEPEGSERTGGAAG